MDKVVLEIVLYVMLISIETTSSCTTILTVRDAGINSTGSSIAATSRETCQGAAANKTSYLFATWEPAGSKCLVYTDMTSMSAKIYSKKDSQVYFMWRNSSRCNCIYSSNEWTSLTDTYFLTKTSLESRTNITDIFGCANQNRSFVFDFLGNKSCYLVSGRGSNNATFTWATYVYLYVDLLLDNCSVPDVPFAPSPTVIPVINSTLVIPVTSATTGKVQAYRYSGDGVNYPLAIRPAYVVLAGLGGGCLLLTLTAVVALCQGKMAGKRKESRRSVRHAYKEEDTGTIGMRNHSYDDDAKASDSADTLDLTDSNGVYFNRSEVTEDDE